MGDTEKSEIERAATEALAAANAWRGERWFEPADLELSLRLGGELTPALAGWEARLGNVEVAGADTAVIALEMVRDVFRNTTRGSKG